jgi:hypothetical protein
MGRGGMFSRKKKLNETNLKRGCKYEKKGLLGLTD